MQNTIFYLAEPIHFNMLQDARSNDSMSTYCYKFTIFIIVAIYAASMSIVYCSAHVQDISIKRNLLRHL